MLKLVRKYILVFTGIWAALMSLSLSGCMSGGFKYTREYAGFINKQNIIIRIILYILTGIVFVVTFLLDVVIFNTMDFWEGRVAAGSYQFKDGDKTFYVEHKIDNNGLRESTIVKAATESEAKQEIILRETADKKIQVVVNGKVYATVDNISLLPKITYFNALGKVTGSELVPLEANAVAAR